MEYIEEVLNWHIWNSVIMQIGVVVVISIHLIETSTWYKNWKHKRRFKKSDYALSSKDVVIKGE